VGVIWILLIVIGGIWAIIEFVHVIGFLDDTLRHIEPMFTIWVFNKFKRSFESKAEQKRREKEHAELKKKIGTFYIVELKDEKGVSFYIAKKATGIHYNELIYDVLREYEDEDETIKWIGSYEDDAYHFETSEKAQEKINEIDQKEKDKKERKNYRKVVGEFKI